MAWLQATQADATAAREEALATSSATDELKMQLAATGLELVDLQFQVRAALHAPMMGINGHGDGPGHAGACVVRHGVLQSI